MAYQYIVRVVMGCSLPIIVQRHNVNISFNSVKVYLHTTILCSDSRSCRISI